LALLSGLPAWRKAWSEGPRQVTLLIWSSTEERPVRLREASRDERPQSRLVFVLVSGRVRAVRFSLRNVQ
jgi:hypothetical protein